MTYQRYAARARGVNATLPSETVQLLASESVRLLASETVGLLTPSIRQSVTTASYHPIRLVASERKIRRLASETQLDQGEVIRLLWVHLFAQNVCEILAFCDFYGRAIQCKLQLVHLHAPAYVSVNIRQHTSAEEHTAAYAVPIAAGTPAHACSVRA